MSRTISSVVCVSLILRVIFCGCLLVAVVALAQPAAATTITALGAQGDFGPGWRSTDVTKTAAYDPNHDGAYGSNGYYYVTYNDEWTGQVVKSSLPAFLDGDVAVASGYYLWGGNSDFDDPSQPIGPSVADIRSCVFANDGIAADTYSDALHFTLATQSDFVLTVILDGRPESNWDADRVDSVKVTGPGSSSSEVSGLDAYFGNTFDYAFFRIRGNAGDTFTVSLRGPDTSRMITGLGFEAIPEPSTLALLTTGLLGLLCYAWRRRKIAEN